jgi:hypothetical protein
VESRGRSRSFQTGIAIAFLATTFAAFAPTYYLKGLTHAPPLGPLVHVHGAACTAWLVLLLVQTRLVAGRNVALHRRLGVGGAILALVMVPLGVLTAIEAARHGNTRFGLEPLTFLVVPLSQIVLFGVFVTAAIWKRRTTEWHRRLIVVATTCLMPPAISRLPFVGAYPFLIGGLSLLFLVAGMVHDRRTNGRVHGTYIVGAVVLVVSGVLRFPLARTEAWHSFARFLVS